MTSLDAVAQFASEKHAGQKDKLDRDYVEHHLKPIVAKLSTDGDDAAAMGGWLHDIVEDQEVTLDDLLKERVPLEVVRAVDSVSKRKGEFYEDLITRAAADPLGRRIKLADNEVNRESNADLAKTHPKTAARLLQRYERAHQQLQLHPSHLFVVHGKVEQITHDVAIVPTDADVMVEAHWDKLTESAGSKPQELPDGWRRWDDASLWLVDVASGDVDDVLCRLRHALRDIKAAEPWRPLTSGPVTGVPAGRRPLPLVAVPVLGIGRGGHAHEQGDVLHQLIKSLREEVSRLPFDIALVTPDPAVYAAAQHARRRMAKDHPLADKAKALDDKAKALAKQAREGNLALFLGAGVSIPAGLPTWKELVDKLAKELSDPDRELLDGLEITDKAQLIEQFQPDGFKERVAKITREVTRPSLVHGLLAGLDVAHVVTTNYDTLFESAMKAARHSADVVMPHQSAIGQHRWVLKMHGDVDHADNIVLTRRHMVMYDAANRPSAALLQSLLLTQHLVIVGASMTDPNIVRLTHEVDAYRKEHMESPHTAYGTVLDAGPSSPSQARLWKDQLDWVDLVAHGIASGPRTLEILLDLVGMHASTDSSWLIDERFSGLLDNEQRDLAQRVRELAGDPAIRNETWAPLRDSLRALGATEISS